MAQEKKVRKPSRVVFSLGVPMTLERRATKIADKMDITRNAYIVGALEDRVIRDEHVAALEREAKRRAS